MLKWIAWNWTVFDIETVYLCWIELFEIETVYLYKNWFSINNLIDVP